jgi:hypothetical protein
MTSPLDRASFVELLEKRHREVAENKYKQLPTMIPKLYNVMKSDAAWESFYSVGSIPDIPRFNGVLTTLGIAPGYYTRIEPVQFAAQIVTERRLMDTKQYPVFDNIAEGLVESAYRVREKSGARTFGYGFSTAFDFMESEEGVALFSSSHTTKAGTSSMSKSSVAATRVIMKQFRNDISERIDTSDDFMLIFPDELEEIAYEIVKTPSGYDTAGSDANFQYNRYELVSYSRLSDIDSNNWFMGIRSRMKKDLLWVDAVGPETKDTVDWDTFALKQSIYDVFGCGWKDWRWCYGHEVS